VLIDTFILIEVNERNSFLDKAGRGDCSDRKVYKTYIFWAMAIEDSSDIKEF
jgi:hypothetical protein